MRWFLSALILSLPCSAHAARVIMQDGKIFEGKIIAETDGDILIKTSPVDRPKLLPYDSILSVTRDPVKVVPPDPQRYVAFGLRLSGDVHASKNIEMGPHPGLALDAGFRFHPLMELGANLEWAPGISGELNISGGTNARSYESFYMYGGALWTRIFPFFAARPRIEPFLTVGYHWNNLIPKASDDALKGGGITGGAGVQWHWRENLYAQTGFLYQRGHYGSIEFQNRSGSLDPPIQSDTYSFFIGLSWHVL